MFSFFDTFIQLKNLDLFEESLIAIYSLFNDNINNDEDIQSIVSNKVRTALFQNSEKMFEYLSLILAKVAGQHERITHASSSTFEWTLHHYEIPQLIKLDKNGRSIITLGKFTHLIDVGEIFGPSVATTTSSSEINPTETTAAPSDPLSDIPQFKVTGGAALQRLDKIKTLIIIMKENRSFDHLLGGLKDMTPKTVISPEPIHKQNYECFDSTFSNLGTASFRGPIKPIPAKDAGFRDLFKTPVSPEHGHEHVLRQIGDGTELGKSTGSMQGFVRDFSERVAERPLLHGGSPSMVMSYYDFTKLDAYKFFAEKFCVLDHWFAAHPGPTWPNRIATHTGKLIDLENFDLSDSRIGYFKEQTIFDLLSTNYIEWRFFRKQRFYYENF